MLNDLLLPMFDDEYYPDILVAEVKQCIVQFAKKVAKVKSDADIYDYAHEVVAEINEMKPQFEDLDSSLDDTAADYIAEAMMMVVQDQGYMDIEIEELVVNREWWVTLSFQVQLVFVLDAEIAVTVHLKDRWDDNFGLNAHL